MKPLLAVLLAACPLWAQSVAVSGNAGVSGNVQVLSSPPSQQDQLNITTTTLPAGDEGVAYSELLAAFGGVTPYVWTLEAGDPLPPGLSLAGGGESLTDPSFDLAENEAWIASQDFNITGGAAVYAHSAGAGFIQQGLGAGATGLAVKLLPGATYNLTYTVSGSAGNPVAIIPTIPATTNVALDETNGEHTVSFTAHADPHSFAISVTSDSGDDTITITVLALEQQTGIGTIFGTPTAPGAYPFTVRVTDAQPEFDTQVLSITIDPAAPGPTGELFTSNGEDTGDLSAWACDPTCTGLSITSTGVVDGSQEIAKSADGFNAMVSGIDDAVNFGRFTFHRSIGMVVAANQYNFFEIRKSDDTVQAHCGPEPDFDWFCRTPGQTTFSNRGFFLGTIPEGVTWVIRWRYAAGTADNAEFEVILNDETPQSFTGGTVEGNVDKVGFNEANVGGTNDFLTDMLKVRDDTFPIYEVPTPAPPPGPENCEDTTCVVEVTVNSGANRKMHFGCASTGTDRDVSTVVSDVDGALTKAIDLDGNGVNSEIWYLDAPTVGTHQVTVTFVGGSDSVRASCGGDSMVNKATGAPASTATNSTASGTSLSVSLTTSADGMQTTAVFGGAADGNCTMEGSTNEFFDAPGPSSLMFGAGAKRIFTTASTQNRTCTVPGAMAMTGVAASWTEAGAAPSGTLFTSYGGECNAVADDQPELQTALNDCNNWANGTFILPAGSTCRLAEKVVVTTFCSNKTILGQGATMKARDGLCAEDPSCPVVAALVDIRGQWVNPTFDNWDFDGNRANRTGGHNRISGDNFRCAGCTGVTIRNMNSKNAPNDNLRVSAFTPTNTNTFAKNWTVIDSVFENAFRNNVSVIEGWGIRFLGTLTAGAGGSMFLGTSTCVFRNANGGDPESGLGLEPNDGAADPSVSDVEVDGCYFPDNAGTGFYNSNKGALRNVTVRNSIFRGNGATGVTSHRGNIRISSLGFLAEGNWFNNSAGGCRFAHIYHPFGGCSGTPPVGSGLTAGRCPVFQDNFIDGQSPICSVGGRRVVDFGGFGGPEVDWLNNVMTNIGISSSGDWCDPGTSMGTVSGNTVDGVPQSPTLGCP